MVSAFGCHNLEYRLIGSLNNGGEHRGVISNRTRRTLKLMPSNAYWDALGAWNIRTGRFSAHGYFRRHHDDRQLAKRTPSSGDPEARQLLPSTGLDGHLPPPPDGLLKAVDFAVTPAEEQYLSDLIATSTKGSMLSGNRLKLRESLSAPAAMLALCRKEADRPDNRRRSRALGHRRNQIGALVRHRVLPAITTRICGTAKPRHCAPPMLRSLPKRISPTSEKATPRIHR